MDPFGEDIFWDDLDCYNTINDFDPSDFCWVSSSVSAEAGVSLKCNVLAERGLKRGREQKSTCCHSESKACREKLRREKMNDRFSELCSFLHPERPAKTDKSAILGDAICALNKLQFERQELEERKRKLQDNIRNLKAEKNELKEEKLRLRASKDGMELRIKATTAGSGGFVPVQTAVHQATPNKMVVVSDYRGFPMWQWICPAVLDTSKDHVLRPPVA